MVEYEHNSPEKKYIRTQWIKFAKRIYNKDSEFSMIGLTTETLDDLKLFSTNGFYDMNKTETGLFRIKKGKFKCFESNSATFQKLFQLLPNEVVINGEIGHEIGKEYSRVFVESNESKIFPCDVINLDFTGIISKVSKRGIENIFKWIFELQKKYKKNYSLFLTFANTNSNDDEIIKIINDIINENLSNKYTDFNLEFIKKYSSINELKLNMDQFLATGISKILVKLGSENKFQIDTYKFFKYKKQRHNMISLLFNFKYLNESTAPIDIYKIDCLKCLEDINEVNSNE